MLELPGEGPVPFVAGRKDQECDSPNARQTRSGANRSVRPDAVGRRVPGATNTAATHPPKPPPTPHYFRMLTARAITSTASINDSADSIIIANLAQRVSGITSVGLNAVALVNDV